MAGSDYLDSLIISYHGQPVGREALDSELRKKALTENLFVCLMSLMTSPNPSESLLLDDLHLLKAHAEAETNPNKPTLLSSLVCSTRFLRHLEVFLASASNSRGDSVLRFLRSYKTKMSYLHPVPEVSRRREGKGKAQSDHVVNEMHIHKAAQVSQIHELFPDTPTSYVLLLLDHFSNDIEAVTAALLEPESLPAEIRDAQRYAGDAEKQREVYPALVPRSTPSPKPTRRNVFDDDDFDKLRISRSQIHVGRKEHDHTETSNPSDKAAKKAAIIAALAVFDSDDDERDDTYDVADVGGAVDNTMDTDRRPRVQKPKDHEELDVIEQTLFKCWKNNPELFARDSKTRMSLSRQQLKTETGMGDEQIEGWALMLSRDDAAARKLEQRYAELASFGGQQRALEVPKWSASRSGIATKEDTDTDVDGRDRSGRGGASSRNRPFRGVLGFGRGRGSPSGPSEDRSTQHARKRKEQGKGRGGANHNRREGRARKLGRGFGNLPPS